MIKIVDVTGKFIKESLSAEIERASTTVFIFEKEEQGTEFVKILTGIRKPLTGDVFFDSTALKELSTDELMILRRKMGILFKTGGLISNLRVLENILLPTLYHRILNEQTAIQRALELLKEYEYTKEPLAKIDDLTVFEKRVAGIVRNMLTNPEILIFEYPFDGVSKFEKKKILEMIEKLRNTATAIYILSSERDGLLIDKSRIINYAKN